MALPDHLTKTFAQNQSTLKHQQSVAMGKEGEQMARVILDHVGVRMVERIETGWRIHRGPGGRITKATPMEPVSGDFRGITDLGRSVLVEAKARPERLMWSDLAKHQHTALTKHASLGGLSFVVWFCPGSFVGVWDYSTWGLGPKTSLKVEDRFTALRLVVFDRSLMPQTRRDQTP